jgi:hypothetical protein
MSATRAEQIERLRELQLAYARMAIGDKPSRREGFRLTSDALEAAIVSMQAIDSINRGIERAKAGIDDIGEWGEDE